MPTFTFPTGLDDMYQNWVGSTFRFMLLTSAWSPDPSTEVYVAAIVADEYAATSYARINASGKTRTPVLPATATGLGFVSFDCDDPAFGVLSGGSIASWLAMYRFVTNDADSPLVAAWTVLYTANGTTAATFPVSPNGIHRTASACPSDFG